MYKQLRKILLTLLLLGTSYSSFSQTKYDELLAKTGMVKQSEMMVDQMLGYYAKQRPTIPSDVWDKVKNKINYNSIVTSIKSVFEKYYTLEEAKDLIATIDTYGLKAYKPKPEVTETMYALGKGFGTDIGKQINANLKELGY